MRQFVSVMATRRQPPSPAPLIFPSEGEWCVKVLACQDRFLVGVCRRQMKAISYLGQLEKVFGVPVTTRSWTTIATIARVLKNSG